MTNSFTSLSPREQDEALAKAMGWTLDYEFAEATGTPSVPALRDQYDEYGVLPFFTISLDDMRIAEDELRKQQKEGAYCRALADVVQFDGRAYEDYGSQEFESLIYATPAQRAEAAWRVLSNGT